MAVEDLLHVFGLYLRVPDVVGKDEDHRPLVVAARARVPLHDLQRIAPAFRLLAKPREKLVPALLAAPSLARSRAHEDLSKAHEDIL